jgi:hypothetical protein
MASRMANGALVLDGAADKHDSDMVGMLTERDARREVQPLAERPIAGRRGCERGGWSEGQRAGERDQGPRAALVRAARRARERGHAVVDAASCDVLPEGADDAGGDSQGAGGEGLDDGGCRIRA